MLFKGVIKYYSPMGNESMPILTMDNCEAYLLLYIDNELNATEKERVELFLQNEPEAVKLLGALEQTILEIDNAEADKLSLYKTAEITEVNFETIALQALDKELNAKDNAILQSYIDSNPNAKQAYSILQKTKLNNEILNIDKLALLKFTIAGYDNPISANEALLSLMDNEINPVQKNGIATILANHPELSDAYSILQKTRLDNEIVAHPNKESLYRKEKDRAPIVPMWVRYVAAASILLGGLWMVIGKTNITKITQPDVVVTQPIQNTKGDSNGNIPQQVLPNEQTIAATPEKNNVPSERIYPLPIQKFNSTKQGVVKNELTVKNIVTKTTAQRTTNTNDNNTTVLTNNNNEQGLAINNNVTKTTSVINNETNNVATLPQATISNINKQVVQVTYISKVKTEEEQPEVSIAGFPIQKIDRKNKTGKLKQRVNSFIAKAKKEIANREISIAGFDIAVSKTKVR